MKVLKIKVPDQLALDLADAAAQHGVDIDAVAAICLRIGYNVFCGDTRIASDGFDGEEW